MVNTILTIVKSAPYGREDAFAGLRGNLRCLYGGLYAAELVSTLTEEYDAHPGLFAALLTTLRELAEARRPVATIVRFQLELAAAIGYAPKLSECVGCGRPRTRGAPAYFSSTAGGVLCRDCEMHHVEKRRVSPAMIDRGPPASDAEQWFDLLDYHLSHVAGRAFKAADRLRALPVGGRAWAPGRRGRPQT